MERSDENPREPVKVLSHRAILIAALLVLVITVALILLLDWATRTMNVDVARSRLEALKTALSVGAGGGGVVALILAARRQQAVERDLQQREGIHLDTKAHQERVAEVADIDATERRVNDFYMKAAEHIGSENAATRLGGIYALERLSDKYPEFRQSSVDLICAYLRMPLPERVVEAIDDEGRRYGKIPNSEELVARTAAQRVLVDHLSANPLPEFLKDRYTDHVTSKKNYWPGISLDLSGAILIKFDFRGCKVVGGNFQGAQFYGIAQFSHATFQSVVDFHGCRFYGFSMFSDCEFQARAEFSRSVMYDAWFRGSKFFAGVEFAQSEFIGPTDFMECAFDGGAGFSETRFRSVARMSNSTYVGEAQFSHAVFEGIALFNEVQVTGLADFSESVFNEGAEFGNFRSPDECRFWKSTFRKRVVLQARNAELEGSCLQSSFLHESVLPDGWTVDPGDSEYLEVIPPVGYESVFDDSE